MMTTSVNKMVLQTLIFSKNGQFKKTAPSKMVEYFILTKIRQNVNCAILILNFLNPNGAGGHIVPAFFLMSVSP